MVSFRADAAKSTKSDMRNVDRTRKMLKHHCEKGTRCSHSHRFSGSDSEDVNLEDSSEAY